MKRSTRLLTLSSGVRTVTRLAHNRHALFRRVRLRGKQRSPRALTSNLLKQGQNIRASALIVLALGFPFRGLPVQPSNTTQPVDTLAALQARLRAHITQPRFAAAQWGAKIVSLDSGKTLFDHNAGKLFKPASNAKLFTGALALDRLGPGYRIKTSFYAVAKPDPNGVLHGDLIVYGRGDPSFAARFNGRNYGKSLEPLVAALAGAAVRQVEGDLIGDDSHFRGPPFGSSWTRDDLQNDCGAEVSALTQEDNVVDLVFKPGPHLGAPCLILTKPQTTLLTFINRTRTADQGKPRISIYRPIGDSCLEQEVTEVT